MTITVSPFAAALGADISGVDIRKPLSTADRDAICAAWLANLVLRFRGRPMSDEQHMAFTCQFGELEFNPAALIAKQYGVETQTAGRKRGEHPSRDREESALSRSPHQRLCDRAAGGRERGIARRAVDAYDPGKVYLDAAVGGR